MECYDKENRIAVIALDKVGMKPNTSFKILQTLGISQMFNEMSCTMKSLLFVTEIDAAVHVVFVRRRRLKQ